MGGHRGQHRIQKPPTPTQRTAIRKANQPVNVFPADAGLTNRSWWADARTREEFAATAPAQQERMRYSSFGRQRGRFTEDWA